MEKTLLAAVNQKYPLTIKLLKEKALPAAERLKLLISILE